MKETTMSLTNEELIEIRDGFVKNGKTIDASFLRTIDLLLTLQKNLKSLAEVPNPSPEVRDRVIQSTVDGISVAVDSLNSSREQTATFQNLTLLFLKGAIDS